MILMFTQSKTDHTGIAAIRALDPTATIGTALATVTAQHIFGQLDGITIRRPDGPYTHTYLEYRIDLAPNVRVEYRDEYPVCFAVFPLDAVLGCADTTPYFHEPHDGRNDRMWE
jgi:hypothetical protein